MENAYNPWIKPKSYTPPTNIKEMNKKLDPEQVLKSRRLRAQKERIQLDNEWDALEECKTEH